MWFFAGSCAKQQYQAVVSNHKTEQPCKGILIKQHTGRWRCSEGPLHETCDPGFTNTTNASTAGLGTRCSQVNIECLSGCVGPLQRQTETHRCLFCAAASSSDDVAMKCRCCWVAMRHIVLSICVICNHCHRSSSSSSYTHFWREKHHRGEAKRVPSGTSL